MVSQGARHSLLPTCGHFAGAPPGGLPPAASSGQKRSRVRTAEAPRGHRRRGQGCSRPASCSGPAAELRLVSLFCMLKCFERVCVRRVFKKLGERTCPGRAWHSSLRRVPLGPEAVAPKRHHYISKGESREAGGVLPCTQDPAFLGLKTLCGRPPLPASGRFALQGPRGRDPHSSLFLHPLPFPPCPAWYSGLGVLTWTTHQLRHNTHHSSSGLWVIGRTRGTQKTQDDVLGGGPCSTGSPR